MKYIAIILIGLSTLQIIPTALLKNNRLLYLDQLPKSDEARIALENLILVHNNTSKPLEVFQVVRNTNGEEGCLMKYPKIPNSKKLIRKFRKWAEGYSIDIIQKDDLPTNQIIAIDPYKPFESDTIATIITDKHSYLVIRENSGELMLFSVILRCSDCKQKNYFEWAHGNIQALADPESEWCQCICNSCNHKKYACLCGSLISYSKHPFKWHMIIR